MAGLSSRTRRYRLKNLLSMLLGLAVVIAPPGLLVVAALRSGGEPAFWLSLGSGFLTFVAISIMCYYRSWTPPVGSVVFVCYVSGLGWLWLIRSCLSPDWYVHFVEAILVVGPLGTIAAYTLVQSGALLIKKARRLGKQLTDRNSWPADMLACRNLPEVKAFREAIQFDAGPALHLLSDPRPQVRACALAALEFRKLWRVGQAETVLALIKHEPMPQVRALAVGALANLNDRSLLEMLTDSLRDNDHQVRRATADALFWDSERRWSWIRFGVRRALADPALRDEGSILYEGLCLPGEAVEDLTAWAAEKGILGLRSALTLVSHFARVLHERPEETLPRLLSTAQDAHAPPLLRIEMTRLLCENRSIDTPILDRLLDSANPAPMRLIASRSLLETVGSHLRAVTALREIARLPNRELALATAAVVQQCIGVDLGLAIGQPLPPLSSSRAIDIARRLMAWAASPDVGDNALDDGFTPRPSKIKRLTAVT